MRSHHKDVRYATKTSSYAAKTLVMKISIMPRRHQLCHEDINPPQRRGAKIQMSQRLQYLAQ